MARLTAIIIIMISQIGDIDGRIMNVHYLKEHLFANVQLESFE